MEADQVTNLKKFQSCRLRLDHRELSKMKGLEWWFLAAKRWVKDGNGRARPVQTRNWLGESAWLERACGVAGQGTKDERERAWTKERENVSDFERANVNAICHLK